MRSVKRVSALATIFSLWAAHACLGVAVPPLRVSDLVAHSDVVLVADVSAPEPVNEAAVPSGSRTLSTERYRAQVSTRYALMGACPKKFTVEFRLTKEPIGYVAIKPGMRILFLKKSGSTYVPTSPYYPDLPAAGSRPVGVAHTEDIAQLVFAELSEVMASPDSPSDAKWEILVRSYAVPDGNDLFLQGLRAAARNAPDPDLRRRIQAELISRNDLSEFASVCDALAANAVSPGQKTVLLYAIGQRLKNGEAVTGLERLLRSPNPEVRVASAQALWHVASPLSLKALAAELNDPSAEVRYYVIRALADVTGELQWGPSIPEYEKHGDKYLAHWRNWAATNFPGKPNE